jgi:NAD-dependent deacetylase
MSSAVERLRAFLDLPQDRLLLVVTGAGISVASGIPTFRGTDPGAVWKNDVTTLGTFEFFLRDPVESWRWYLSRFDKVLAAEPNPAHRALAELEKRRSRFLLVTQNVDPLHERAGSQELVKVHGSADRIRCARDGCANGAPSGSLPRDRFDLAAFLRNPSAETLPRCPACGTIMRQHVLWFDEYYHSHDDYQFARVQEAAREAERVLFIGTSFSVGVTDAILQAARSRGKRVMSIDPGASPPPQGVELLSAPSEEVLPAALASARARL